MRFEREVNIYGDEVILKRFTANETSISVIQGEISAIISESEMIELIDSSVTMYSKLASAIMDIDSLTINFSDLTTKYNTVSGQYTDLDSKVAQYKASVDGLSANVSQISQNLTNNYSTTTAMNSAINQKANEINASVSATYATKSALNTANGKIDDLEAWKSEASLKITDSAIISTVITSSSYENSVESLIEQNADSIRLKADRISWESTYSSMTADGTLTCENAVINGTLHNASSPYEIYIRDGDMEVFYNDVKTGIIGAMHMNDYGKTGIAFGLNDGGDFLSWDVINNATGAYTEKWGYAKEHYGTHDADTLNAGCTVDLHWNRLENVAWPSGGISGTMNFVRISSMNSNGTAAYWYNNCHLTFENGILVDSRW